MITAKQSLPCGGFSPGQPSRNSEGGPALISLLLIGAIIAVNVIVASHIHVVLR
jgi:hypothetical protein